MMSRNRRLLGWLDLLKEFARDYLLENTGLKILALLITAVIWLSVASRPVNEITLNNVPIEFHNPPESSDLIVADYDTLIARVSLRGPRDVLDSLRPYDLTVVADMANLEPGVRFIPLRLDRNRLPTSVEGREIDPQTVRVTIERAVEAEVPVKPRIDGRPPAGYEVTLETVPSNVVISGPASQVRQIKEVSTETVSLTGKTSPFTQSVAIDLGSANVDIRNEHHRRVQLRFEIYEVTAEKAMDRVPVNLVGWPPGATPRPAFVQVLVSGPKSIIDSLTPSDIVAEVEYNKDQRDLPLHIAVTRDSDRITVRGIEPASVRVRLR